MQEIEQGTKTLKPTALAITRYGAVTDQGMLLPENYHYIAIPLFGQSEREHQFEKAVHEQLGNVVIRPEHEKLERMVKAMSTSIMLQLELEAEYRKAKKE